MPRSDSSAGEEFIPLKAPVFYILLALAEGDSHGYGVIQTVRDQSEGRVTLPTGAFYRHLAWLIKHGLVEESNERPLRDDARRGVYYRVTSLGRDVLSRESERMAQLVSVVRKKGLLDERRSA